MDGRRPPLESTPLLVAGPSRSSSATTCSQVECSDSGGGRRPQRRQRWVWRAPDVVENAGSMARDMFAAERTFLSWLRLSLAVMGTGAVALADIAKLHSPLPDNGRGGGRLRRFLERYDAAIGLLLFCLAAFALAMALLVFSHSAAQLAVLRRPLRRSVTIPAATVGAVAAAALVVALTAGSWRHALLLEP